VVINNSVTLEGALPAMEMVWGKYYKLKVIYSQDGEWYRAPLAVNKVETLPGDTNCHLINPPTEEGKTYRFKMPISRVNEFWSTTAYDGDAEFGNFYNAANIIGAEDRWVANIIWKDVDVTTANKNVTLIDFAPNGYRGVGSDAFIEFDITYDSNEPFGNAVIGIKKGDENFEPIGDYLWSWHIWVSDYAGQTYDLSDNRGYLTMDRNLGARSNIIGDPSTMGLVYQFGRKDPFVTGTYTNFINGSSNVRLSTTPSVSWVANGTTVENGNVPYTVKNPTSFVKSHTTAGVYGPLPSDWQYEGPVKANLTTLWKNTTKTIFDPCPKGYKVARRNSFDALNKENTLLFPSEGTASRGRLYNGDVWFPFQGYLGATSGSLSGTGTTAYGIRTSGSSTGKKDEVIHFYARICRITRTDSELDPDYNSARAHAMGVRCMEWPADN
ncbi:MAG: hypothetical protein WC960_06150, partial [Bacteroidales bacterium]